MNEEQKENAKELKALLKKAKYKVYTIVKHVSNSGMMRIISAYIIIDNEPRNIDWYIEKLGLFKRDDRGLKVSGCGMDMGFHIVYELSGLLYPKGFRIGKNEWNRNAINGMKPTEKGYNWDSQGGYKLTQIWL